ncbi:MAG: WD40/YVTN/BNR-like repeat-containing protein [Pyrinomonadaceae bacterium]
MIKRTLVVSVGYLLIAVSIVLQANAQTGPNSPTDALSNLSWRSIGPANMGGRVADVEGVAGNPNIVYVATGSGGIFKTTNGGMTWTPIFDRQNTISVGDIALEPGNPDVIWVGTGESNTRNSVSFGDGVYRSTDGGKTWKHLGLAETNTISKVVIHPKNPDIVYVAAVGRVWGPNEERGVFMTTDGGKTWQKTLYIDPQHGASDLVIDPQNPNILYAGMWRFERKPWTFTSGSDKGGVFRSTDGGRTWSKVEKGLPKMIGRIGLDVSPANPDVVYAILEAKEGTLYRSDDKGETFRQVHRNQNIVSRGFYYTTVRVDPTNENKVYAVASLLFKSLDGGRTFSRISPATHIDFHALWIDPQNPKRMWQGQDGGVAVSYDEGSSWEYVNNFAAGQFYQIFADNAAPFYNISGGLQDNGTWVGPSRNREPSGIHNDDWRMISFGDGFFAVAHPDNPDLFLTESQGGNVVRTDMKNREQQLVVPFFGAGGAAEFDKVRFNWNAPLIPSPHDKNTVYLAGSSVYKTTDFGRTWTAISQDLTTNNRERLKNAGGPIFNENTSAEYYGTVISLAESPVERGQIWAGTDDGNVQLTNDGGKTWTLLTKNFTDLPADSPVSHVEPSRTGANIAYVAFDRHKLDDYRPYVYKTTDGGRTFTSIAANLPAKAYVHVVKEDPKNANLLYAGTELGLYASWDGGRSWSELNLKNLPRVAVHDIIVHPRDNDLILGTHGRSIYVFDDATPIQQMNAEVAASDAYLFDVRPAYRFSTRMTRYGVGDKIFRGQNPPSGALITYYLKNRPDDKTQVRMQVLDAGGRVVFENKNVAKEKGLNRVTWGLRHEGARLRRPPSAEQLEFAGPPQGPQVLPGTYKVRIFAGDKLVGERTVEVRVDPSVQVAADDLRTQYEMAMKLRDMVSLMNDGLRQLDSIKAQTDQIESVAKDRLGEVPADLTKAIADFRKRTSDFMAELAVSEEDSNWAPSRYADQLSGLYFTVSGGNAAPTPTMKENFEMLQREFPTRMSGLNRFVADEVAKFNQTLQKYGLSVIVPGKPVEPK